jgi:hypothetical protein
MPYDLIDRLGGYGSDDLDRINPQAFTSALAELAQGEITKQAVIDHFQLDAAAVTQLDWLIGRYNAQPTAEDKTKFIELLSYIMWMAREDFPGYNSNAELAARISRI